MPSADAPASLSKFPIIKDGGASYGAAILLFILMLSLRFALLPAEAGMAWLTFCPGVALASFLAGVGPSIAFIALAAAAANYFFIPPSLVAEGSHAGLISTGLFILSSSTTMGIISFFQRQVTRQAARLEAEIEGRRRVEKELRKKEERLRLALDGG